MYKLFFHYVKVENKYIKTCGILVCHQNRNIVRIVFDVSTDYVAVKELVDRLNKGKVDPVHLDSILYDFYLDNA